MTCMGKRPGSLGAQALPSGRGLPPGKMTLGSKRAGNLPAPPPGPGWPGCHSVCPLPPGEAGCGRNDTADGLGPGHGAQGQRALSSGESRETSQTAPAPLRSAGIWLSEALNYRSP